MLTLLVPSNLEIVRKPASTYGLIVSQQAQIHRVMTYGFNAFAFVKPSNIKASTIRYLSNKIGSRCLSPNLEHSMPHFFVHSSC